MLQKLFVFLFAFSVISSYGQYQISGQITDAANNPLSGCHIHIASKNAVTDATGNFSVSGIPSGKISVYITFVGYATIDSKVDVNSDLVLNFTMQQKINDLDAVVLKTKKNSENVSVAEQKIKIGTIEKYSSQTLGDALREIPGVSSLKTGSTVVKPVINGLHSSRVPVINNNVRMEDQQWGTEHAPNFDINSAGKITVIKGASALQYGGDAIGGLVIIDPVTVKKDTLYGKTIINGSSNGRGGSISSSLHKGNFCDWSWNALGTFKYFGDRQAADYTLSNTGNREFNFSGDLKYIGKKFDATAFYSIYNAKIGILAASHTGNATDLFNSINNQTPSIIRDFTYSIKNPRQEVRHHLAKLNYNYYFNENETLSLQYSFQMNNRLEFDLRRGDNKNRPALDLELITHTFNTDYKKKFETWNLKSGIVGNYQNNFADPATGVRPLIPTYDKFDAGVYGVADYKISETMTIESGLRYDFSRIEATKFYYKSRWTERGYDTDFSNFIVGESGYQWLTKPEFTYHNLSGGLGFHKEFKNDFDWFVNLSVASRNPNPAELFSDGLHHSSGVIELGDLRLEKEQSFKVSTTLQKKWTDFTMELNPYLNNIQNYIFLVPIDFEDTTRDAFPVWEYRQTNARIAGVDLRTDWNLTANWSHHFTLSYVNGEDVSNGLPLIDMPPLTFSDKVRFERKEWSGLLVELRHDVVFSQNRFPNNNFETNIVVNNELTPVTVDISTPPSSYQLLDFYSEMTFKGVGKGTTTLAFSVQNILNTNYRDYLNRQRLFADEMGRNFQIQLKFNY